MLFASGPDRAQRVKLIFNPSSGWAAASDRLQVIIAAPQAFNVLPEVYRVDAGRTLDDGLLDLVVYAELSKVALLGSVIQAASGGTEDERVRRYPVRQLTVGTNTPRPVVVDGFLLGQGPPRLSVRRRALNVIAAPEPPPATATTPAQTAQPSSQPEPARPAQEQAPA
jgi:YegS C-terminal NAD kinase beta sandwich-like domain